MRQRRAILSTGGQMLLRVGRGLIAMGPQQGGTALRHSVQPYIDGLIGIVVSPVGLIHQRPYDLTGQRHQRRDAVGQRCPRHAVEVGKAHPHSALLRQILGDLLRQCLSNH